MSNVDGPPDIGTIWTWEPKRPHARAVVRVIGREWRGEEWWIKTRTVEPSPPLNGFTRTASADDYVGKECWNDHSRWKEAAQPGRRGKPWRPSTVEELMGAPR